MIYDNILGTIGRTPIVKINRLAPSHVTMYVKCEFFNPLSSVKTASRSRSSRMPRCPGS
jgi:cysteine synthase